MTKYVLAAAAFALLLTSSVLRAEEYPAADTRSTDQLLRDIDRKLDELLDRLGDPSGRTPLADQVERNHHELKQDLKNLENSVRKLEREVQRVSR